MKKNLISLSVAFVFLVLASTGILLYIKQKSHAIEISHTVFGLLFVTMAAFHIYNNWISLKSYSTQRKKTKLSKEIVYLFITFAVILTLSLTSVLEPLAEFGRVFAKGEGEEKNWGISFSEENSNQDKSGKAVVLMVQKNEKAMFAALTIDIVDANNKLLENLYSHDSINQFPPSNLLLNTKIRTAAPLTLRVTMDDKGKKTIYNGELKSLEPGVYAPIQVANTKLERLLVEIK